MAIFADEEQAIAQEHPLLQQVNEVANLINPFILQWNHSNTPEAANLAKNFHQGSLPSTQVARQTSGELPCLIQAANLESTAKQIAKKFRNLPAAI